MKPISTHEVVMRPVIKVGGSAGAAHAPSNLVAVPAVATGYEDPSRYCPVCSQRLESTKCKLICTVCGYYMSCADYY